MLLFLYKTNFLSKNIETYQKNSNGEGLTYENNTVADLINQDTDGDGILDWQESLYGLDLNKKETTPGIPDSEAINKLKITESNSTKKTSESSPIVENLSKTDQFSRELFATIAAASQNGTVDQATIDQLGASLAEKIKNPVVRKVYSISDMKIVNDDSLQAFINYNNALNEIYVKYPTGNYTIIEVLQKFMIDENNVDASVLVKLDPIIKQINQVITTMVKTSVPQSISSLHLNMINSQERLVENLIDIKLYDDDAIVALGGFSKYAENATKLDTDIHALGNTVTQKFKQQ